MSGPTSRAVPLSQIIATGPMMPGEALAVVREVTRRAQALAGSGVDYALDAIRIDELGGVRCRPTSAHPDPVPALGKLLEQLVSGTTPAEPSEDIMGVITRARARAIPDLPSLLREIQTLIDEASHGGGLRSLALRAHATPPESSSEDPPSETELWPFPRADQAAETWYHDLSPADVMEEAAPPSEPSPTLVVPLDMASDAISIPPSHTAPSDPMDAPRPSEPSRPPAAAEDDGALDLPALIGVAIAAGVVGAGVAVGLWWFSAGG